MKRFRTLLALMMAAATPIGAVAATPEATPIEALDTALIATMKAGSAKASFQSRYDALAPVVKSAFNLPAILQSSAGFRWTSVPGDQQQEVAALFEQYTVASYVDGFKSYSGQTIEILPAEKTLGAKMVVETRLVPGGTSAPVRLDYVMAKGDADWQVTDVLLNSTISKVAVQSSEFSALVKPGDASKLITALKSKISTLSGGSLKT